MQLHPDPNPATSRPSRSSKLNEAYDVLKDEQKRLPTTVTGMPHSSRAAERAASPAGSTSGWRRLGDIARPDVRRFMGGRRGGGGRTRAGADIRQAAEIDHRCVCRRQGEACAPTRVACVLRSGSEDKTRGGYLRDVPGAGKVRARQG
jgi:DnaJ-class molecular chaperone